MRKVKASKQKDVKSQASALSSLQGVYAELQQQLITPQTEHAEHQQQLDQQLQAGHVYLQEQLATSRKAYAAIQEQLQAAPEAEYEQLSTRQTTRTDLEQQLQPCQAQLAEATSALTGPQQQVSVLQANGSIRAQADLA